MLQPYPSGPRRTRGRPNRSVLESLRVALAFNALKSISGMSWMELERTYIADTNPKRFETMIRKPDAFLRYANGEQLPRGAECEGSPIQWAKQRFPNFERIYNAPLFEVLPLSTEHEALTHFTNHILWRENRINREICQKTPYKHTLSTRLRYQFPIWSTPRDVVTLKNCADLDALCLILVALKFNLKTEKENLCTLICAEWMQAWVVKTQPSMKVTALMLKVLGKYVPALDRLFDETSTWRSVKVDLHQVNCSGF